MKSYRVFRAIFEDRDASIGTYRLLNASRSSKMASKSAIIFHKSNPKLRFLFAILTLLILLVALERVYYLRNRGFRIGKLISFQPTVNTPPSSEIDLMLDQSFRYFGCGKTTFVFLGEDGKTILKLFKHHHLFYKSFLFHFPFPGYSDIWRVSKRVTYEKKEHDKRHPFFFNSCAIAFSECKEETGLIYLCLQPNLHFNREIKLIDAWGIPHHLNLSKTEFALQKKTQLFFPYLEELLKQDRIGEMRVAINSLITQIVCRCKKGIGDQDPNLKINFGFLDGKVIEFDLGSYYVDPSLRSPLNAAREVFFTTSALQQWLEKHSPDLLDDFLQQIATMITTHLDS